MGAPPAIIEIHSDIHLSMLGITPVSDDIMQRSEAASDLSFRVVMRLIHRTCRGFGAWTHGSSKVPESLFEFREAMPRKPMFKSRGRSQRDWTREEKVRHYDRMLWITITVRSGCSRWMCRWLRSRMRPCIHAMGLPQDALECHWPVATVQSSEHRGATAEGQSMELHSCARQYAIETC